MRKIIILEIIYDEGNLRNLLSVLASQTGSLINVTRYDQIFYIQCSLSIKDADKRRHEERSFLLIRDSFRKILIEEDDIISHYDENGVFIVGIRDFISDEKVI